MATINFHNVRDRDDLIDIVISPVEFSEGTIALLLPPIVFDDPSKALDGVQTYLLRQGEDIGRFYERPGDKQSPDRSALMAELDLSRLFEFSARQVSALRGVKLARGQTLRGLLTFRGSKRVPTGRSQQFSVMQRQGGVLVGGSTFDLRLTRAQKALPVSRIRVTLEKVQILDDKEPWFKGRGDFVFRSTVDINQDACRRHRVRMPERGIVKISDKPGQNVRNLNVCVVDGYLIDSDRMTISVQPVEQDWLDPDDKLTRFRRAFDGPPESWVGRYGPDDEVPGTDSESLPDWKVWYRVESLPI
jgi:hypothetical protein